MLTNHVVSTVKDNKNMPKTTVLFFLEKQLKKIHELLT